MYQLFAFRDMYFIAGSVSSTRGYLSRTIEGAIYNFTSGRKTDSAHAKTVSLVGTAKALSDFNSTNFPELFI